MRRLLLMLAALIAIGALPAAAASFTLNETGGTCNHTTGCTFALGFTPTSGQLLLFDPSDGAVGDVITFDSLTQSATLASDSVDGFDDPGDTFVNPGLLPPCASIPIAPCAFTVIEPPTETLTYTPTTSGQPGFGGSYSVTSDSHPNDIAEPSSMLLLGAGLLGIAGIMRRKLLG